MEKKKSVCIEMADVPHPEGAIGKGRDLCLRPHGITAGDRLATNNDLPSLSGGQRPSLLVNDQQLDVFHRHAHGGRTIEHGLRNMGGRGAGL